MLVRLLGDAGRSSVIRKALEAREPKLIFNVAELARLKCASQLTSAPTTYPWMISLRYRLLEWTTFKFSKSTREGYYQAKRSASPRCAGLYQQDIWLQ